MARRLTIRVLAGLVAVFGVILLSFILQVVIPGDPVRALAPREVRPEVLDRIRERLRLDDPVVIQFLSYVGGVLRGDLGQSYIRRQPVTALIMPRLSATAMLVMGGVIAEILIGGTFGVAAALNRRIGRLVASLNLALLSIPTLVVGLTLLLIFGFDLRWFPVTGGASLRALVLPSLTIGLNGMPWYAGVVRDQMAESLSSPYVRTAIAKGLPVRRIILHHSLRNVFSPVLTMLGMDLGTFFSGVVVVEVVFGWPGIGNLAVQSLANLDRPLVMGVVILGAIAVVLFNFLADVVRMWVDPRTRDQTT